MILDISKSFLACIIGGKEPDQRTFVWLDGQSSGTLTIESDTSVE